MSQRWRRADIPLTGPGSSKTVPIVGDAAIATQTLGEGRFIPVLIIDTSDRPDIDDLVKVLKRPRPGDVTSQWGRRHWHRKTVALILTFERPSQVLVILEFDVTEQGILVDSILTAKALFLQPGRKGDRLSATFDSPRILVEVPARGWKAEWDKLWSKALAKKLKEMGLKRQDAKKGASAAISLMREMEGLRPWRRRGETDTGKENPG